MITQEHYLYFGMFILGLFLILTLFLGKFKAIMIVAAFSIISGTIAVILIPLGLVTLAAAKVSADKTYGSNIPVLLCGIFFGIVAIGIYRLIKKLPKTNDLDWNLYAF